MTTWDVPDKKPTDHHDGGQHSSACFQKSWILADVRTVDGLRFFVQYRSLWSALSLIHFLMADVVPKQSSSLTFI